MWFRISPQIAGFIWRSRAVPSQQALRLLPAIQPARTLAESTGSVMKLHRAYQLLGIGQSSTVEEVKEAYICMVKKYHPDSSSPDANPEKFSKISEAYKRCASYAKNVAMTREIYASLEQEQQEIEKKLGFAKHKRLAHRHYLVHDVGVGTYSQRHKAHAQVRLDRAVDNVFQKKLEKALANPHDKEVGPYTGEDPWLKRSMQGSWVTHSIERVADDLIRESMVRGDFSNLEGSGKPIRREYDNVALDSMTQRLNKMLIASGCAPEWVFLNKEIRDSVEHLRSRVTSAWHKCGPCPMARKDAEDWEATMNGLQQSVDDINAKIRKLNLIAPALSMQKASVTLDTLVARVASEVVPEKTDALNSGQERGGKLEYAHSSSNNESEFATIFLLPLKHLYNHFMSKIS